MGLKHFAIALTIAMPIAAFGQVDIKRSDIQGDISRAVLMHNNCNYVGALHLLSQIDANKASAGQVEQAKYYTALSRYELNEHRSVVDLVDFIETYPSSRYVPYAWATVGDHYFFNGKFGDAARTYREVSANGPDLDTAEDVKYRYGYSLLRVAEYDAARPVFDQLATTSRYRGASTFYNAYINYAKGKYEPAKKMFSSVKGNPQLSYFSQYYLAQIAYTEKDYEKASSLGNSLLRDANKDFFTSELYRLLGESQYQLGNDDTAYNALCKYINDCEEAPIRSAAYAKGVIEYRRGDYEATINSLSTVIDESDALAQSSYLYIGQSCLKLKDNNSALIAFEKAVNMDYDTNVTETAYYNYAVAQNQGGRTPFNKGIEVLETFLSRFPNSRYANEVGQYLVGAYLDSKDYNKALQSIAGIKSPDANVLKAKQYVHYNLGIQELNNSDAVSARRYLQEAAGAKTSDKEITNESRLWLAEAQYRLGDYGEAEKNLRDYISAAPKSKNSPIAHYNLGYALFQQRKYSDASSCFKNAVSGLSGDTKADAFNRLGDTQYYAKQYATASTYYSKAYELKGPGADYSLYQNALMKALTKNYKPAIAEFDKLLNEYPNSGNAPLAMLEKAAAQIAAGDAKAAGDTYAALVADYPKTSEARKGMLEMAINERNSGKESTAITYYKKVIEKYPTSDEAKLAAEDLKLIYADNGKLSDFASYINKVPNAPRIDVNEMEKLAFEAAEKAVVNKNEIGKMRAYLDSYPNGAYAANASYYVAKHEYQRKNYDEALVAVNKALKSTDAPFAEDALAIKSEILMKQGKNIDAMDTYKSLEAKASSTDTKVIANLGILRASADAKKWDDVNAAAEKLLQIGGLSADEENEVTFHRALAAQNLGNDKTAVKYYSQLAKSPSSLYGARAAYNLAQMQYENKEYKTAEKSLNSFIDNGTPHQYWLAKAFILLSDVYHKQNRDWEACEYLESLKVNYPGSESEIFKAIDQRLSEWKTTSKSKKK